MEEKKFNIGDEVTDVFGLQEGKIIAYALRPEDFKERHSYKVRWKGLIWDSEKWSLQALISKIEK